MKYIRWFQDIQATDVELVGGKGANLGEMARAGLPVPPGFCVAAEAYRDFIGSTGLSQPILEILDQVPQGILDIDTATERIRALITSQPVPDGLRREILESYMFLGQQLSQASPASLAVAVRSSATAEDLPTASFAGQQDTYLNVRGEESLIEHVKSCWASLWTARATSYRARQGFDHTKVYLAVVVQSMISSEISGILFTANPVDGDRDVAVVNASWGLGEAIVSGLVTPDTLTVHKGRGEILSRRTASKDCTITYAQAGGVEQLETPPERREIPALTDAQVLELVSLGCQIERHYGAPQDIEWAYMQGRWYVLQVRPVTTLTKVNATHPEAPEYHRTMFVEIFPDPLTPIFSSVIQTLFKSMLDFTFRTWGFKPPQGMQAVGIFYDQPYFNRNYIEAAFKPLSPEVRDLLVDQVVNPFGDHKGDSQTELSWPYLRMAANTVRFMLSFPKQLPDLLKNYHAEVAEINEIKMDSLTDQKLVSIIDKMVFGSTRKLVDYDFLLIAVVKRVYHLLGKMLEPYFGEEAEVLRGKLISGVTGNVTMDANIRLWDLARLAKASPEVSSIIRRYQGPELVTRLEDTPDGRSFMDEMNKFIKVFGHREVRLDILYPTWCDDPAPVFSFIRGYLDLGNEQDPRLQQKSLIHQRLEMKAMVREKLAQSAKGRFVIWPLFHWVLENIEFHTRERDTVHFEMTRIFPPFRRFLLELGRRWAGRGLLSEPQQIFFLSFDEIRATAEHPQPMGELARQRQEEFEINKNRLWPDIIREGREIYTRQAEQVAGESNRLEGVPGSPGVVTGRVCVIRGPEEFHRLQPGDILVAPITNPVWTPLFAIAGGVITEVGGILSHGAIVAREYGIPAVMSIAAATRCIRDGETVVVDGNRGWVYVGTGSG